MSCNPETQGGLCIPGMAIAHCRAELRACCASAAAQPGGLDVDGETCRHVEAHERCGPCIISGSGLKTGHVSMGATRGM